MLAIGLGGAGHPIHDVTTDPEDRLAFTPDVAALEQLPMTREEVLAIQREIYPDLAPLELPAASDLVFARALDTAASMEGWEVIHSDAEAGRIEAAATSAIFHFVDDVVIQVEAIGSGSRIDVRSRSRMGRSDLGANAERIRAFLARLKAS